MTAMKLAKILLEHGNCEVVIPGYEGGWEPLVNSDVVVRGLRRNEARTEGAWWTGPYRECGAHEENELLAIALGSAR
jgi:hypothetical protein